MCREHVIARNTVLTFIKEKSEFTFSDVKRCILRNKGIMRVSIGVTVKDYLEDFEKNGVIKYKIEGTEILYTVNSKFLNTLSRKRVKRNA